MRLKNKAICWIDFKQITFDKRPFSIAANQASSITGGCFFAITNETCLACTALCAVSFERGSKCLRMSVRNIGWKC